MSIAVTCPKCGKAGTAPAEALGKKCRCKACRAVVTIQQPNVEQLPIASEQINGIVARPIGLSPIELRQVQSAQAQLLGRLKPIPEASAQSFFARFKTSDPLRQADPAGVFHGLMVAAGSSSTLTVQVWFTDSALSRKDSEALCVLLDDCIVPLGLVVCTLNDGTYLSNFILGRELKQVLSEAEKPPQQATAGEVAPN